MTAVFRTVLPAFILAFLVFFALTFFLLTCPPVLIAAVILLSGSVCVGVCVGVCVLVVGGEDLPPRAALLAALCFALSPSIHTSRKSAKRALEPARKEEEGGRRRGEEGALTIEARRPNKKKRAPKTRAGNEW